MQEKIQIGGLGLQPQALSELLFHRASLMQRCEKLLRLKANASSESMGRSHRLVGTRLKRYAAVRTAGRQRHKICYSQKAFLLGALHEGNM